MPTALNTIPYTKDTYSTEQTSWSVNVSGKAYKISTSGQKGDHTAVCLFSSTDHGCYWAPSGSSTVFFKQYDGNMSRQSGSWVQIKLPSAKSLHNYTFGYNLQDGDNIYKQDSKKAPPQSWIVLGSNDGTEWEEVSRGSAGVSRWTQSGFDIDGEKWPQNAFLKTDTINKTNFTYYRFLFPQTFGRLDRIQMMVKTGPGSTGGVEAVGGENETVVDPADVDLGGDEGIVGFIKNNQYLLVGGAIAIVVVIMMMNR